MIVKDFDDYREMRQISLRAADTAREAALVSISEAKEMLKFCHDYVAARNSLRAVLARIEEAEEVEDFLNSLDYRGTCGETMDERWNEEE